MTDSNPAAAYLRTRVLTATPEQLRMMLLEGAVKFARQGREGLAKRNYEAAFSGITQSRDIVLELMLSIKPEVDPELASRVRALYTFIYKTMVEANMERDIAKADKAIELLEYECETWRMVIAKLAEERAAGDAAPRAALSVQA